MGTSFYKGQLDDLMKTLYATDPSFIRCVVPNTHKQPGVVDSGLVMHQYQCNGVLAGIAICRKGFPNKIMYPEFKSRYNILAAAAVARAKKDKDAAAGVFKAISLDPEKWRLGHTKVFFRAGIWVSWKRFAKTGLVKFCLGFKLKPEERPPDWSSRKCKTKSLLCTVSKGPSGTTTLV